MGYRLVMLRYAALVLLCLTAACNSGSSTLPLAPTGAGPVEISDLQPVLDAELARLGIDPGKAAAAAPTGADSVVFDLGAALVAGDGQLVPDMVQLNWTGMLPGDYDQNGEVNAGDLAPLAINFGATVEYLADPPDPDIGWWPAGDVTDTGDTEPGTPPAPGSGAHNWRLARIDGDHNGEINAADVAVIAQHWMQRASGYRVYRAGPDSTEYVLLPNPASAVSLVTRERPVLGPGMPERYTFNNAVSAAGGYSYYVAPYDVETGLVGEQSPSVTVYSNSAPTVTLAADPSDGNSPLTVNLTVTADESDAAIVNYAWDFEGDGEADLEGADLAETSHVYGSGGSYYPGVVVTDENGKYASASANVRVDYPPIAFFTVDPTNGVPPLMVTLDASGSTDPGGSIVHYRWDLDGGGDFEVDGGMVPFLEYEFTGAGTKTVRLQVEDNDGYTDTMLRTIRLNSPPVAHFSVEGLNILSLFIPFDASETYDPDGDDMTLAWDFEPDGVIDETTTSPGESVVHYYSDFGEYRPTLTVTDENGASAETFLHIRCMAPPVADLSLNTNFGGLPLTVTFDASGSSDEDGTVEFYEFDFNGDGVFDTPKLTEPVIQHTYYNLDAYPTAVRVTDNDGNQAVVPGMTIHTSYWRPVAEFSSRMQSTQAGGFSLLQVGNRMAVAYSTPTQGLMLQFSEPNSLEQWSDPISLRPPSEIRGEYLMEIAGAPCLFYIDDDFLYMLRGDAAGGTWSQPVQISEHGVGWRQFYDVAIVEGRPCVAYYSGPAFTSVNTDGIYFVRSNNAEGTDWGLTDFTWSRPGLDTFDSLFITSASDVPYIYFQYNSSIYIARPLDPLFLIWTHQLVVHSSFGPDLPAVQRSLEFGGFPLTGVETDSLISLLYYDETSPEGYIYFQVPLDYGNIDGFHTTAVQLYDGLPHMPIMINAPRYGASHPLTIYHYWAMEPSLTSWIQEPVCTGGYMSIREFSRFDGELLAVGQPGNSQERSVLLVRDLPLN